MRENWLSARNDFLSFFPLGFFFTKEEKKLTLSSAPRPPSTRPPRPASRLREQQRGRPASSPLSHSIILSRTRPRPAAAARRPKSSLCGRAPSPSARCPSSPRAPPTPAAARLLSRRWRPPRRSVGRRLPGSRPQRRRTKETRRKEKKRLLLHFLHYCCCSSPRLWPTPRR